MARVWKNNAASTLSTTLNSVGTTLTVASGEGALFPEAGSGDVYALTLQDASGNVEIVLVTAHSTVSDNFTITRAQESTSARSWAIGDVVELRITAAALEELSTATGTETLSNKTLSAPTITGTVTLNGTALTATAAELNLLDGVTAGTLTASKPLVVGADSKIPLGAAWEVYESSGDLIFSYNGTDLIKFDSTGNIVMAGDATAGGTI